MHRGSDTVCRVYTTRDYFFPLCVQIQGSSCRSSRISLARDFQVVSSYMYAREPKLPGTIKSSVKSEFTHAIQGRAFVSFCASCCNCVPGHYHSYNSCSSATHCGVQIGLKRYLSVTARISREYSNSNESEQQKVESPNDNILTSTPKSENDRI